MPFSRSRSFESITRSTTVLVVAEDAALPEHGVHERGLAVVDVGDDGDVAQVLAHGEAGVRGLAALVARLHRLGHRDPMDGTAAGGAPRKPASASQ